MTPQHLGYKDYREFLASDYWKRRRALVEGKQDETNKRKKVYRRIVGRLL